MGLIRIVGVARIHSSCRRWMPFFRAVGQLEGANFLAGRYVCRTGWETFSDKSATCQEQCAAFKYLGKRFQRKGIVGKKGRALGLGWQKSLYPM